MKAIHFIATIAGVLVAATGVAQCTGNSVLHSSKTEYLTPSGEVRKTMDENTVIEMNEKSVYIAPGDDSPMTLQVRSVTCAWTNPFREGKTIYKATFNEDGTEKNITLTIEGKDGKVYFLASFDDEADKRIRVWADSYAGKK